MAKKRRRQKEPTSVFWIFIILILGLFVASVMFFTKGQTIDLEDKNATIIDNDQSTRDARIYTVTYKNGFFSPTNLRIHMGDTVRFKNEGLLPIRIFSDVLAGFDSIGDIPRGGVFSYTFSARGIFQYYNERNESEIGTVIVR